MHPPAVRPATTAYTHVPRTAHPAGAGATTASYGPPGRPRNNPYAPRQLARYPTNRSYAGSVKKSA
ncbi:hypothetical protein GCM10018773_11240 [Streptomyces candidus]|nr:hypothetical protein GCM10018773_11240 [Streptomyces candidus]